MSVIDHIGVGVPDDESSKTFYPTPLAPLGYELVMELRERGRQPGSASAAGRASGSAGQGDRRRAVRLRGTLPGGRACVPPGGACSRGRDNDPPGLRPQDHASYYGAFVLDPDGHNVEAVCHRPG